MMDRRRRLTSRGGRGSRLSDILDGRHGRVDLRAVLEELPVALLHVPLPDASRISRAEVIGPTGPADGPPLYVVEDDDGVHGLVYSSPARLLEAWGATTTAASVPGATLLAAWPAGVDLVIDAGLPTAYVVPSRLVDEIARALQGRPEPLAHAGPPEVVDDPASPAVIAVTGRWAQQTPEAQAAWSATLTPAPNPGASAEAAGLERVLVVRLVEDVSLQRLNDVMNDLHDRLLEATGEDHVLVPAIAGRTSVDQPLIDAVGQRLQPYWARP